MANQIVVSAGAKVRNLQDVIIGTSGVLTSLGFDVANGVPRLDVNGKILVSQLPNSVMEYKGTWNVSTNTPTLVNGTGNQGDVYLVEGAAVGGTAFNFGAGPITFFNGDQAIYSGSIWQRASGATGTVTSVAVTESGDSLNITGSPITTSGTINIGFNGTNLQYVNGAGNLTTFPTLITSIGLTMPSAFSVANSPLTANGTIAVTGAGVASQYIRGDGTLANFPTSGGGGSSVAYYFNSSVSQGTLGGVAYRELSKVPIIGAGTDITIATNGYIANYITDAGDPSLLEIPAGNWNFEMFFSSSSNGGSPSFYLELYKYDGTTFTLISSSSATPEGITNGTAIDLYTTALAVPLTTLTLTDRLAIRVYVNNSGRTITLHTENSHLCEVITTFSTGIAALNGLTAQVQYFQVGTSGTDFNISSTTATHTFNLPTASATNRGALASADWSTFNSKQGTITLTTTGTSGAATFTSNTLNIPNYGSALSGYLPLTGGTLTGALSGTSATFSGNIGIGLSPIITSGGAFSQIFIGGSGQGGVLYGQNNAGSVALVANGYFNASNLLKYINSLNGVGQIYNYNGEFIFSNAPVGTSGGTVTLTPRLTIASTGVATFSSSVTASAFIPSGATVPTNGMYLSAANTLNFATNTTNRLTINSSGNLGLGVTPSAWGSVALEVGYIGNALSGNGDTWLTNNAYRTSGGTWTYARTLQATLYSQSSGLHAWLTAPSGTAGTAITWTQAMTLTAAGRLLLGTTTESTYLLDVNGTGRFKSSGQILTLETTTARGSGSNYLSFADPTGSKGYIGYGSGSTDDFIINNALSANMLFYVNGSQRLSIASTGAATFSSTLTTGGITGIAVSPSPNTLSNGSIDLLNGAGMFGYSNKNYITANMYYNTAWLYKATAAASLLNLTDGGMILYGAPSGTAATAITLTQLLSIASTGAATFSSTVTATTFYVPNGGDYGWGNGTTYIDGDASNQYIRFIINSSERARFNSSGNLLLGSTSDNGSRLQVTGAATFSSSVTATSATLSGDLTLTSTSGHTINMVATTAGSQTISMTALGGGSNTITGTGGDLNIQTTGAYPLVFKTNSTENLRIASGGAATFSGNVQTGSQLSILGTNTGGKQLFFTGGTTKFNFMVAAQQNVDNGFEITPSLGVGGSTFTTPVFKIDAIGVATFINSVTATNYITGGVANTASFAATGYSLTGANAQSLLDLAGTWNTTGNPTAIKLNITNTASGSTSNLMDLQVGAVSKFKVDKTGNLTANNVVGGTYTPTASAFLNCSAVSASNAKYIRVGNIVNVTMDATATFSSTFAAFYVSIPVGGVFTGGGYSGQGFAISTAGAVVANGPVSPEYNTTNVLCSIYVDYPSATTLNFVITFQYRVE